MIFLITFAKALSGIPAGEDLKTAAWIKPAAPSIAQLAWCCGGLTFLAIFCSASYVVMSNVSWIQSRAFNNTSTIFNQGAVFFVAFWLAANGVMNLIVMTTSYYLFWRRHGMDLRASGVWPCWRKLLRSIWLATLVATAAYGIVFVLNYFLEADFRFWLIAVRAFTPDKLRSALLYLPFLLPTSYRNSIIVNCFTFFPSPSRAWLNTAALALFNALALIVLVAAQYSTFYVSGYTIKGFGGIFSIWLFPVIAYLAVSVVIARSIYGATQNPYLGGLINAAIVTMIAVTNTLTVIY